jgi:hypothetical protein
MTDADASADAATGSSATTGETPPVYLLGLVLAAGVVLPGITSYALSQVGLGTLGTVVWAIGYAAAILTVWYVWVRPLDIAGPG